MRNKGSLSGIKVLDLSRLLPGPFCSMILADHGADVIAIEDHRFKQDGMFFNSINRNKRHISLNLKTEEGQEIFFKLAREADVILEGFRPGVVKRLGVNYETVKIINPSIIYCSISGYGQTGPYKNKVGHDVNYLATSGILDLIGPEAGLPSIPGVQFADIAGGSMNAVVGILLALYARTISGEGQYIDISMTDGLVGYLSLPLFFSKGSGSQPRRSNDLLSHRYACYNTYRTADDRFIAIGAVENRFWKRLCELLGVADYSDLQYDDDRRTEIIDALQDCFSKKTAEEWDRLFDDEDVCYSLIQSLEEVLDSHLFRDREVVVESRTKDGDTTHTLGIPIKLSATPGTLRTNPDTFGGSTSDILLELGYTEEQIADYRSRGVI